MTYLAKVWANRVPLAGVLIIAACAALKPKPGDACQPDDAVCQPRSTALVCRAGHYVATSCGGPAGCAMASDRTVNCDQTAGASAGEPCLLSYNGEVQCMPAEASSYLRCTNGVWAPARCVLGTCQKLGAGIVCQ